MEAAGVNSGSAPHWSEHPDVLHMVGVALKKRLREFPGLLAKHHDLDEESLLQDLWGECAKSKFDPALSSLKTHAYRVAYTRFADVMRARLHRIESDTTDTGNEGQRERRVEPADPEAEYGEMLRRIYVTVKPFCDQLPSQKGPGRPTPTFAQKAAISMLMKELGWSCRDAEEMTKRYPGILATIGVTQSRRYNFFSRTARAVTKFARKQKRFLAGPGIAAML